MNLTILQADQRNIQRNGYQRDKLIARYERNPTNGMVNYDINYREHRNDMTHYETNIIFDLMVNNDLN
jgi:hypothetical protein